MITLIFNYKDFPLISIIQEKLDIGHIYKVKGKMHILIEYQI